MHNKKPPELVFFFLVTYQLSFAFETNQNISTWYVLEIISTRFHFRTNFHVSKTILDLEYLMISTGGELQWSKP